MTAVQIVFILIAAVTLGAAVMVVTARNLVHAALWLIVSLFGVAVFYVLLQRRLPGGGAGGDLHRRDRHPDHLRRHADPAGRCKTPGHQLNNLRWPAAGARR